MHACSWRFALHSWALFEAWFKCLPTGRTAWGVAPATYWVLLKPAQPCIRRKKSYWSWLQHYSHCKATNDPSDKPELFRATDSWPRSCWGSPPRRWSYIYHSYRYDYNSLARLQLGSGTWKYGLKSGEGMLATSAGKHSWDRIQSSLPAQTTILHGVQECIPISATQCFSASMAPKLRWATNTLKIPSWRFRNIACVS